MVLQPRDSIKCSWRFRLLVMIRIRRLRLGSGSASLVFILPCSRARRSTISAPKVQLLTPVPQPNLGTILRGRRTPTNVPRYPLGQLTGHPHPEGSAGTSTTPCSVPVHSGLVLLNAHCSRAAVRRLVWSTRHAHGSAPLGAIDRTPAERVKGTPER